MLVDSHCHLNFPEFKTEEEVVLNRARAAGVQAFLTICTKKAEIEDVLGYALRHEDVYASVGVHPHEASDPMTLDLLLSYGKHPRVVGYGETGLDYYYEHSSRSEQQESFALHLEAAVAQDLPLIVHTREAEEDTIALLKNFPQARGVIHCFTGSPWLAKEALDLGFYISLSGVVTFKKATELQEIAKTLPLDRLLVETDAPFLAPVPHRGKRNEPAFVVHTAQFIADLKLLPFEMLAKQTTSNFYALFLEKNKSYV